MEKSRFVFLDGIRGFAALFVLVRHTEPFWGFAFYRSYLAVDIFFMLSGFVIANAYDHKLKNRSISKPNFLYLRLVRLYPLFIFSVIVTAAITLICAYSYSPPRIADWGELVLSFLLMSVFLPSHLGTHTDLFPLNGPYWSLSYELLANGLYAYLRPVLTDRLLLAIVCALLGLLGVAAIVHGSLDVGYSWGYLSAYVGFIRSSFGISCGLLLYRHHTFLSQNFTRPSLAWLAVGAIFMILASPKFGQIDGAIDFISVGILFPVCVIAASKGVSRLGTVLIFLGMASYPVYVLHQPIATFLTRFGGKYIGLYAPFSGMILVLSLFAAAWLLARFYDTPLRRRLMSFAKPMQTALDVSPVAHAMLPNNK